MPRIIPATPAHAARVAADMRQADIDEVRAAAGLDPCAALLCSMESSDYALCMIDDRDEPFAIFGVGPGLPGTGSPWLLGTPGVERNARWFLRVTPPLLLQMHERYPVLLNYVDARNRASILWLTRWMGFQLDALLPFGVEGRDFFQFSKVASCVFQSS